MNRVQAGRVEKVKEHLNMMPNVLLLVLDSFRYDLLVRDGQLSAELCPNLTSLARRAVFAKCAFANGNSTPISMPSLMTGVYPWKLKMTELGGLARGLVDGQVTLADRLCGAGYTALGIHSNPFLSPAFGFDQGFDSVRYLKGEWLPQFALRHPRVSWVVDKFNRLVLGSAPFARAESINRVFLGQLGRFSKPWFAWLHYMDTHGPYLPTRSVPLLGKWRAEWLWRKGIKRPERLTVGNLAELQTNYLSQVRYLDAEIGSLLAELDKKGHLKGTLVVVTADHGEEFLDHGEIQHPCLCYDTLIHVPLLLAGPGMPAGLELEGQLELVDLFPTLLSLLGLATSAERDSFLDGQDFSRSWPRTKSQGKEYVYSVSAFWGGHWIYGIRSQEWKLIVNTDARVSPELYHLPEDQKEKHNVYRDYPAVAAELRRRLEEKINSKRAGVVGQAEFSPDEEELLKKRLEDLGYL